MTIYIQSRGKPQEKDYKWQRVRKNNFVFEVPPILKRISVGELIQSEKYSIVLARNDRELVLLVTGLSSERIDFMNRRIRNSVAWVEPDSSENEQIIRSLVVLALTDKQTLENKVNEAVVEAKVTSEYHFEVNWEKINQLSELKQVQGNNNAKKGNYIGNNSVELQTEVGLELQANCLPSGDGVLVLATTLKTESDLKQYNVWRGLSNKVPYEELKSVSSPSEQKKSLLWQVAIAVAMAVVIIIIAVVIIIIMALPVS